MPRELGIFYKPDMHLAVREGRKTQTRRIVKPQGPVMFPMVINGQPTGDWFIADHPHEKRTGSSGHFPRYRVGDLLYVKEAVCVLWGPTRYFEEPRVLYRSDGALLVNGHKWRSPLHMPKWAARTWLEVTGVRAERLQDITEADAIAEGVAPLFTAQERASRPELDVDGYRNYLWHGWVGKTITQKQADEWPHQYSSYDTARGSYSSLWESINGPGSWAANPWVWVYEFKRIKR